MEPHPSLFGLVGPESSCPVNSKEPPRQIRIPMGLQPGIRQTNTPLPGQPPQWNPPE